MEESERSRSLAVRYRPKSFAEVIGQPAIISILSRQIETHSFKNTYLFCGPSGCGKTTCARIMANEINGHEGEPIEIDAASNNGVDNIRQLIVDAQQTAIDTTYKVYIIDECHMLTTAAWNAALKLIEEPPSNAIFIFCTTNPNKIPETILTRVQRFDFKRVSIEEITDRLEFILNEENFKDYDRDALRKIAYKANGFVREAVSLLDKCKDQPITIDNISATLGFVKDEILFDLLKNIIDKNTTQALDVVKRLKLNESNLLTIVDNLLGFIIDCAKVQKTHQSTYGGISGDYENYLVNLKEDLIPFVDRVFKYRQLCDGTNADVILDMIVLELCGR